MLAAKLGIACHEMSLGLDEFADADEVFATNSLIAVTPVRQLDERNFTSSKVTGQFADAYRQLLREELRLSYLLCWLAGSEGRRYHGCVKLARQIITKSSLHQHQDDNFVPGTEAERILMVWSITREIAALNPDYDVERRLQRHVVRVARRAR